MGGVKRRVGGDGCAQSRLSSPVSPLVLEAALAGAGYSATYGGLGAVIVLMLWLYLIGLVLLIGGEINCEIERAALKPHVRQMPTRSASTRGQSRSTRQDRRANLE